MRLRLALATALALGATFGGSAAHAESCVGTTNTVRVCVRPESLPTVDPTGSSYDDCIWVGLPECVPVSVPIPSTSPGDGSQLVTVYCGGDLNLGICHLS